MLKLFFLTLLTFVSLLNPIQKIFVIFSLQEHYDKQSLRKIINRSSITAFIVLILFLALGNQILGYVFNIEIYAFQIICGIVLSINGLSALQNGAYAGPATITAAVTMPSLYGVWISLAAVSIGVAFNWVVMRNSNFLGELLNKYNLLNPLSRIFGLIVAAIGTQMILSGISVFVKTL